MVTGNISQAQLQAVAEVFRLGLDQNQIVNVEFEGDALRVPVTPRDRSRFVLKANVQVRAARPALFQLFTLNEESCANERSRLEIGDEALFHSSRSTGDTDSPFTAPVSM